MARSRTIAFAVLLVAATVGRGQDRPLLMDPGDPVTARTPVRPVSYDPDRDDPPPSKPAARFKVDGDRRLRADQVERPASKSRKDDRDPFLDRPSDLSRDRDDDGKDRRRSSSFGERLGTLFGRENKQGLFCSDRAFDQFAAPITNPFLFEDPRPITELRPVFIYQNVPNKQPTFNGGDLFFFGGRGSLAITDRLSITVNKIGALGVYPGSKSILDSEVGFAELWLGPKITWYRDAEAGTIISTGTIYQIPIGNKNVFQDTGRLTITPYITAGQTLLRTRYGSLNGIAQAGYSFGTDDQRSDYFNASAHLDFDLFDNHRIYPVLEMNWFQYTADGKARPLGGEGRDLINFGAQAKGSNLLTGAVGGRFRISDNWHLGGAAEFPLIGNKDLFKYRFTVDVSFRF